MPKRLRCRRLAATTSARRAVFLTQAKPKQTQGSDIWAGTSLDQIYAQKFGQGTPLPSMQFCIENLDQAGGCTYNYSCAYTDSLSWASPNEPLADDSRPARRLRHAVRRGHDRRRSPRPTRKPQGILDWISGEVTSAAAGAGRGRPHPPRSLPRERSGARTPHQGRRSRTTAAASRANCPMRQRACPIPTPSTSS